MRRLIINADDFGLTAGVNRGIIECVCRGVVTSTTLMANGAAFGDAIVTARKLVAAGGAPGRATSTPAPSVGCHLMLVDGVPSLPPDRVTSLVSPRTGEFRTSFLAFAGAVLAGRLEPAEVTSEAEMQVRKIQCAGVRLSHLDTHKHAHLFPAVLLPVLRAARACGVRAVRNPFAPLRPLAFAHLARRPHLWTRYTEVRVLRAWVQSFRRTVEAEGMVTTNGTFGIVSTGALDLVLFRAIAGCIPEGTWELCCHPGYNDVELAQVRTRLRDSRDHEREVFTSAAARAILEHYGIELISYWDLQ